MSRRRAADLFFADLMGRSDAPTRTAELFFEDLMVEEQSQTGWRFLAVTREPFSKWPRKEQLAAEREYRAAKKRELQDVMGTSKDFTARDAEIIAILEPYQQELKDLRARMSHIRLTSSHFQTSMKGDSVTFTATVALIVTPKTPLSGNVVFNVIFAHGSMSSNPVHKTLSNNMASWTIGKLPKGKLIILAEYPDTGNIIGSDTALRHEVTRFDPQTI